MFRKEAAAAAQYSPALVGHCAALGASILDAAAALVKPGGYLLLSTCTFAPQEDEAQAAAFLARHPAFVQCDLSACGFGRPGEENRAPAAAAAFSAQAAAASGPPTGERALYGAFAKARRRARAAPPRQTLAHRQAAEGMAGFCQRPVPLLAAAPGCSAGDFWMLLPAAALPETKLHILRAGVPAGRAVKGRFEPAHALFMAHGARCRNREELTWPTRAPPPGCAARRSPRRPPRPAGAPVLVDGLPLGGGKVSGGRVKNHYPKALRNLG